jgi:hypothetical protein
VEAALLTARRPTVGADTRSNPCLPAGSGFDADFAYGPPKAFYAAGQAPQAGRLYVDRFGWEREETYVMDGSKRELVSVDIWDVIESWHAEEIAYVVLSTRYGRAPTEARRKPPFG